MQSAHTHTHTYNKHKSSMPVGQALRPLNFTNISLFKRDNQDTKIASNSEVFRDRRLG